MCVLLADRRGDQGALAPHLRGSTTILRVDVRECQRVSLANTGRWTTSLGATRTSATRRQTWGFPVVLNTVDIGFPRLWLFRAVVGRYRCCEA